MTETVCVASFIKQKKQHKMSKRCPKGGKFSKINRESGVLVMGFVKVFVKVGQLSRRKGPGTGWSPFWSGARGGGCFF